MKNCIIIFLGLIIVSCNPFRQYKVLDYESDFLEISDYMKDYRNVVLDCDEDDRFASEMKRLKIDIIVKNLDKTNNNYSGFIEENDSLLIFIRKSNFILVPEKRIIYDFARIPRKFGSDKIVGASYTITQLNDRWYFTTIGLD